MWRLYDELIDGIAENLTIEDYNIGCAWTMVQAGGNAGVALTVKGHSIEPLYQGPVIGESLKTIAALIKSWNFIEASLGMAAINCYYNSPQKVAALGGFEGIDIDDESLENNKSMDAFSILAEEATDKRVAVIGHFPHIERTLRPLCKLSILERDPDRGDYPDSACDYILIEQDMVFVTGMTFTNKTLPHLLQVINPAARIILVGPSVPLTPLLYKYGATDLDGFCVTNPQKIKQLVRHGQNFSIFSGGKMVSISKG
jgi:uncharacterized protein (DUF4213/DUF364 family)